MFFPIPLEMKLPQSKTGPPAANVLLIAVNVLLFALGGCWPVGPGTGVFSVFLYGFSHFGFWHLVLNMWVLWVFGNPVNRRLGNALYLLAYLGCIVAVGLFARVFLPALLMGSSGAVFGVLAMALILMPAAMVETAYLAFFPMTLLTALAQRPKYALNWFISWGIVSVPALVFLVLIPMLELASFLFAGFSYGWSWTPVAHLLGMACGVAIVLVLPKRISMRRRWSVGSF